MKINEIIRKKRKEQGLTQEQLADLLNITAPAVNKWENGFSYPDITTLPTLARLLKTDLNELLSFNEDLTDEEIVNFTNNLVNVVNEKGFDVGYEMAMEKISSFPTCEKLIASVAPFLNSAIYMYAVQDSEKYKEELDILFKKLINSEVVQIKELATTMLINRSIEKEDYKEAEDLINNMSQPIFDRERHLASLYLKQGKINEALKLWQLKMLKSVSEIQSILMSFMDIAIKENRIDDASFFADTYKEFTKNFSYTQWTAYTAQLEFFIKQKDTKMSLETLNKIQSLLLNETNIKNPIFYTQITKEISKPFSQQFTTIILNELKTSNDYDFLREEAEFLKILKRFEE